MRRRIAVLFPALLAAGWLLSLFAPVLSPARALANRDIAVFHLPLRAAFRELAAFGPPVWNPWLHGGQPVLSNPSYSAFYPPSWLVFAATPAYALSLLAVLHGALAFAGAWRLARRLGCGAGVAALAGIGYVGCGAWLSLLSAYTLLLSLAWLPWVLAWGDAALREERWTRPALLAGLALGLQLLNGEPSTVIMSGLALLGLALSAAGRRRAALLRAAVPVLFAVALAAVQIVPTLGRLADSSRQGLDAAHATLWSMRPARLAELVFPRVYGDPARHLEGRFFGWTLNDRSYPYVESLYPGLLLAVLGGAALIRGGIPRRAAWTFGAAAGCFLALGRHNPLFEAVREAVPALAVLRFPEKFMVLAVLCLAVAGVLAWQRLLDDRDAGRPESADFPLALAGVALAAALTLALVLAALPRAGAWYIAANGAPDLTTPARQAAALDYLRGEGWRAVATAALVAGLLALCRWRRPPRRLLEALAALLLAADLWHYGHGLVRWTPAAVYHDPPALAAGLLPAQDRLFVQGSGAASAAAVPRQGEARDRLTRADVARLRPWSGLLWSIPYQFETDFDLMLTGWSRRADGLFRAAPPRSEGFFRYLGAWNVRTLVLRREQPDPAHPDPHPFTANLSRQENPYILPRFRFVPRVTFHPDWQTAAANAAAGGWGIARHDHLARPGRPAGTVAFPRPPRPLEMTDAGGRIGLRYQAEDGAFFIIAMTFDEGWRATLDGAPLPVYPTAAGQLAVVLPAGEHQLVLQYRDPLVAAGAAATLAALLAGAAAFAAAGRRPRLA